MGFFTPKVQKEISKDDKPPKGLLLFFTVLWRKLFAMIGLSLIYTVFALPMVFAILTATPFMLEWVGLPPYQNFLNFTHLAGGNPGIAQLIILGIFAVAALFLGPANCGMAYVMRAFVRQEHVWPFYEFFRALWKNIRKGLLFGFLDFIVYALLLLAYSYYSVMPSPMYYLQFLVLAGGVVYTMMRMYVYDMIVTLDLKTRDIFRNAFYLSIARLPRNLIALALCILIAYGTYMLSLYAFLATPFFLFSVLALIVNIYTYPVIRKHLEEAKSE